MLQHKHMFCTCGESMDEVGRVLCRDTDNEFICLGCAYEIRQDQCFGIAYQLREESPDDPVPTPEQIREALDEWMDANFVHLV